MENKKTIETLVKEAMATKKKLSFDDLQAIADENGYTMAVASETYEAVKKQLKEEKKAQLANRLKISYGKSEFVQKAVYLSDKDCVIFRNLDKNAIIVVREKEGALVIECVSVYSEKSKKYEFGKALAQGNANKVKKALQALTEGVNYETFKAVVLGFSNTEARESKGTVEKALKGSVKKIEPKKAEEKMETVA